MGLWANRPIRARGALPPARDRVSAFDDARSAVNGDAHRVTEHDETLSAGELQAALSNAIVRIMRDFYGKGAARSRTTIFDEYVFVVLEDVLTTAEIDAAQRRRRRAGAQGAGMRFEDVMTATFVGEVERLTGRTVVAYHSQAGAGAAQLLRDLRADLDAGRRRAERAGQLVEAGDLEVEDTSGTFISRRLRGAGRHR